LSRIFEPMFGRVGDKLPVVCWRRRFTFAFARGQNGIRRENTSIQNKLCKQITENVGDFG